MTTLGDAENDDAVMRRAWAEEVLSRHWPREERCVSCVAEGAPAAWPCMPARAAVLMLGLRLRGLGRCASPQPIGGRVHAPADREDDLEWRAC